jgi:hypothetical protein
MVGHNSRGKAQIGTPNRGHEASSRAEAGRVCSEPGCTTILSTYNPAEVCGVHERLFLPSVPPTRR